MKSIPQKKVLAGLIVYGPCSNKDLAERVGFLPDYTYTLVYALRRRGLAACDKTGYFATDKGRAILKPRPRLFFIKPP